MTDAQLEKAARWLCVQRSRNPNDMISLALGEEPIERWRAAAHEIKAHEDVSRAAVIANLPSDAPVRTWKPLSIYPTPDDVWAVRSENARRFDRILEDVEANKVPTWALQAAARAWCEPTTRMIEMDSRLAIEFAKILVAERRRCEKAVEAVLPVRSQGSIAGDVGATLTRIIRDERS